MTLFSLICCLLVLSSSAFGLPQYGSYSSAPLTSVSSASSMRDLNTQIPSMAQLPIQTGYGQQQQPSTSWSSRMTSNIQQDTPFQPTQQPITSAYGSSFSAQQLPQRQEMLVQADRNIAPQSSYGSQSYGSPQPKMAPSVRPVVSLQQQLFDQQQLLQQKIQEAVSLSEADILCRGQRPETVIPIENGRRFVVCLDDSKGFQQGCPSGLYYHPDSRRCERKLGPLDNPCASQPCLFGGQCVQTDASSYQCQCTAGYDGKNCELDSTACQTQQPCGQSPDTRCQSFRVGAALQYICILQNGYAYGLNAQQAQPNPCQGVDGTRPLAISDKGFIMCDGEQMFVESCPGGTVWDDYNKACVWPDMQGVVGLTLASDQTQQQPQGYGQQSSYGQQQRPMNIPTPFGTQLQQRPALEQRRILMSFDKAPVQSGYGSQPASERRMLTSFDKAPVQSGYGSQPASERRMLTSFDKTPVQSGYGSQPASEQRMLTSFDKAPVQSGYGSQPASEQRMLMSFDKAPIQSGYGSQPASEQRMLTSFDKAPVQSSYGSQQPQISQDIQTQAPQQTSSYGSQQPQIMPKPQIWQQPIQSQQDIRPTQQQSSGY
jgi:hypothetical protein